MKEAPFSSLSKPLRIAFLYFIGVVVISSVGGFWGHYELYGYWFKRPDLLDSAKTIVKVERFIFVRASDCREPKECSFVVDSDVLLPEILNTSYYDDLYKRLLSYLQSKGRLPISFDGDLKGVVDLYTPMMQTPIIATPDEGFSNHHMSGIILIGETSSGEKRAFISAIGNQIADEHAPYYEAIFKIEGNDQSVQYIEGQRFFFDTDLEEGILTLYIILFLIIVFGGVPTVIVIIVDDLLSQRKKLSEKS